MASPRTLQQSFSVPFEYPVVFSRSIFAAANPVLGNTLRRLGEKRSHRVLAFVDSNVAAAHHGLLERIGNYFGQAGDDLGLAAPPRIVPGGEEIKQSVDFALGIVREALELHIDRHSYVIAIGGGATLDAVGFAAALVHRGLRLVRVPTTVLSQNDAGVGVKNGINFCGGKNAIGTFSPPFAVINDFDFLATLPDREWSGGIAEAFKVSIIRDAAFFSWLCKNARALRDRDAGAMEHLVIRCADLHLQHIRTSGDPFEYGSARPLDFGHWSAHKLEGLSGYGISHGHAVAMGIALDACYAKHKGWLKEADFDAIHEGMRASGLSLWFDELETRSASGELEIFAGIAEFQEHLGGELCVTFPDGLGKKFEVHELDTALVLRCLEELKARARQPS